MWILYYKSSHDDIDEALISEWLNQLPAKKRQSLQRRQQNDKKQLSLIGWQLLRYGMHMADNIDFTLQQVEFPENGKPHIPGDWDFNISHSGDLVVCAICSKGLIGIDVERHRDIDPQRFARYFTKEELAWMGDSAERFIELWTKKEAVIKASGIGLRGLSHVITGEDMTARDDRGNWCLSKLEVETGYSAHVATNQAENATQYLQQVKLEQLCQN